MPAERTQLARGAVRPLVLFALFAVLISLAWLSLQQEAGPILDIVEIVALALLPGSVAYLSRRWWAGAAVLVLGLVPAAGIAFGVSLTDMRPGSRDFFGPVFDATRTGFEDYYEAKLPFDPLAHPEMAGLALLALYGFLASAGIVLARRRSLAAGFLLVVAVGWPTTLAASVGAVSPLRTGALVLAAILVTLFVTRGGTRRPLRGLPQAAVLGAVLVLAAVGASTSGAVAKEAFLDWQHWDLYNRPKDPVGVRYVWSSNYAGITFPKKSTVVLKIKAPKRSLYWRAATLDEFTGVGWREGQSPRTPVTAARVSSLAASDPLLPSAAHLRKNWTKQQVSVVALSDTHLVAASEPVRWQVGSQGSLAYAHDGSLFATQGLRLGSIYTVWSYAPVVRPAALSKLGADYPDELAPDLEVVPEVRFPAFGTPDRAQEVDRIFEQHSGDADLGAYEPVYRKALAVVQKAASPYLAAASLEAWFRSGGGFTYDEHPPPPVGAPPLVDFVLRTKAGYCQHFAGAMAVMLRMLGIPSRVAVGFTSGKYNDRRGEWTVTDHDAHAWVEVWFPNYGWLPFDPTPGRGQLAEAYSTASAAFPSGGPGALGVAPDALSAILRERLEGAGGKFRRGDAPLAGPSGATGTSGGGLSVGALVFIVLAGILALLLGAKALRRRLRFLPQDPRKVAAACRRDLVAYLADQGIVFPESATLSDIGHFLEKSYRVNATPFVRVATAARFGGPGEAADAARRSRRELRTLLRELRRQLSATSRARGALSLRSLAV